MRSNPFLLIAIVLLGYCISMPCNADIGGIGPGNIPPDKRNNDANPLKNVIVPKKSPEKEEEHEPLLVIDFDKIQVHFENQIRQIVKATEASQALASYEVVSTIPSGDNANKLQFKHMSDAIAGNLDGVVSALQANGVPSSRIQTRVETSDSITHQQVSIFVQ